MIETPLQQLLMLDLRFDLLLPVRAYIDPATTTYLIQIVSALVITLGVTVGVFFSRMRLSLINMRVALTEFFIKLLARKKNSPKLGPAVQPHVQVNVPTVGKWRWLWTEDRPFRQRFVLALLVSAAWAFTFVFFGAYELYMLNFNSFMFSIYSILGALVLATIVCGALLCGFLLLLRGRVFDFFITLSFGMVIAGYIQGNFLNTAMGLLSGEAIAWESLRAALVGNTLLWLCILLLPFLLRYLKRKAWSLLLRFLCFIVIIVQVISLLVLQTQHGALAAKENRYLSTKGIYELAAKNNIVVIVLDRLDNRYIESVLKQDPAFFNKLDGFTRFTNNLSLYSQTFPSVANMFTGYVHQFERSDNDFLSDAWTNAQFLPKLREQGYRVNLYMEPGYTYAKASDLSAFTDNIEQRQIKVSQVSALKQFMLLSALRYAPLSMKPFFWTSTDQFNKLVDAKGAAPPYITDDVLFYNNLRKQALSKDAREGQFTYIHLNGPHAPYEMNDKAQAVPERQSSAIIQTKGSFHIVFEYLKQLKKLGLYKDSTIVIMGDHGSREDKEGRSRGQDIVMPSTAIVTGLFVKPAGQAGSPLALNAAPVSSDNLRPFIYKEAGLPYSELGKSYFEVAENAENVRYLYHRLIRIPGQASRLLTYEIKGDANDFANWKLIKDVKVDY